MTTIRCGWCGESAPADDYHRGDWQQGQHWAMRYCPNCGLSVDWGKGRTGGVEPAGLPTRSDPVTTTIIQSRRGGVKWAG